MARRDEAAKGKKPVASATTEAVISQFFRMDSETYLNVRTLAAKRRGTGRASTAQGIYMEAVKEYLNRNAEELNAKKKGA